MHVKRFLLFAFTFSILLVGKIKAQENKKPNILFVYVDDLGWKDLSCYGSQFYETPGIDGLADDGVRFTSAYQAAARSVPSRTSLLTGKYHERPEISDRQGVKLSEYTFAEAFQDAGYHTYFAGKWHLGKNENRYPDDQGFDVNKAGCEWGAPKGSEQGGGRYFSPYDCPTLNDGPDGEYLTDRLTEETLQFIENHQKDQPEQPFFACLFHYAVHTPIEAPESAVSDYRQKRKNMNYLLPDAQVDGPARVKLRQDHPVYAGMIDRVDTGVQRLRDKLKELGISDNTIIIVSSDHGGLSATLKSKGRELATSNYPLRTGKGWIYEGGIRTPLIVYWPGHTPRGMVTDESVVNTDFYPTMLEMAGLPLQPNQHKDGESFASLLEGKSWSRSKPIYWYWPKAKTGTGNPNMAAIREGDKKLIHFPLQNRVELYDLNKDLRETHNLAHEYPLLTARLENKLMQWKENCNFAEPGNRRVRLEKEEMIPEYALDIEPSAYPRFDRLRVKMGEDREKASIRFTIKEENNRVHPVNISLYYRTHESQGWQSIQGLRQQTDGLLPGEYEVIWNITGMVGETIDLKIGGHIANALHPEKLEAKQLSDVLLK